MVDLIKEPEKGKSWLPAWQKRELLAKKQARKNGLNSGKKQTNERVH